MTTTSIVYLAIGIGLILVGAAIRVLKQNDLDNDWSHPVSVGCIIIGIAGIACSIIQ